jgi:transposase
MTTIEPHLSVAELERRYKTAGEPVAKSHFHALWLVALGHDVDEVAELLSFSVRWVRSLVKRYNESGPGLLGDQRKHNGTAPKILTPEALAALKERLKAGPDDGGLWSGPKIARWLAQYHGLKSVHDQRGWDALIAIAYSIQQPRPRHPKTATAEDRARLKKSFAALSRRSAASIPAPRSRSGRRTSIASV